MKFCHILSTGELFNHAVRLQSISLQNRKRTFLLFFVLYKFKASIQVLIFTAKSNIFSSMTFCLWDIRPEVTSVEKARTCDPLAIRNCTKLIMAMQVCRNYMMR